MKKIILIVILIVLCIILATCTCLALGIGIGVSDLFTSEIGFDLRHSTPSLSGGDMNAATHIFIHNYPMPSDGWLVGVRYLNDSEQGVQEIPESIVILVLRHESGGFRVIGRQELPVDDVESRQNGITTYRFPTPIRVAEGDLLGHYQPAGETTGPIPLNVEDNSIKGLSLGKAGFSLEDTQLGSLISESGFTGLRDYYITAILRK